MPGRVVDPVVIPWTVTVPAGTPIAAPMLSPPELVPGRIEQVEIQIPPGHVGATGIRFTLAGQQILPWSNDIAWIIGDNLRAPFPLDIEVANGFVVVAYNTGNYDHSFYLRFTVRQLDQVSAMPTLTLVTNDQLSSTA